MLKYVSKLSNFEIYEILKECSLLPVTFNNNHAIKKTTNKLLITCIKTESLLYKTIIDWNEKHNSFGELFLSYVEKSEIENFVTLSLNDFEIKIINKTKNIILSNENHLLNIKLNSLFLKLMLNKFENTNYILELNNYNFLQKIDNNTIIGNSLKNI